MHEDIGKETLVEERRTEIEMNVGRNLMETEREENVTQSVGRRTVHFPGRGGTKQPVSLKCSTLTSGF